MLQLPTPGTDTAQRRAGWHKLAELFSGSLRESLSSEGPLDLGYLRDELGAWESFARAWDGRGLLSHPNTLDEWERMRAMLWCAEYVQKTGPRPGDAPLPPLTEFPVTAPTEVRDRSAWSLAFIRLLRGEIPVRRIAVPIALADEMVQLKGGIATLVIDAYTPGTGQLTLHPEESFHILPDADFTESLNSAWQLALEIAAKKEQGNFPDVVWWLMKESPSMSGLEETEFFESAGLRWRGMLQDAEQGSNIKGRSASGAAARAFRHLLTGTSPEPDIFILAQVRSDVTPTAVNHLQAVGGISAKVQVIADTDRRAVVIVTEKDKAEADLAVSKRKAGSRIQIEVNIPPSINELLDDAKKLSEDDRFGEAIPILEKALTAAQETNHRTAEAKIRIRLGHALFEASEDFAGAENHFRKALDLVAQVPSSTRHSVLHGLGDMLLWAGQLDEASAVIHASLEVAKSLSKQDARGRSLISLGLLERKLGHVDAASSHLREAIRIFNSLSLTLKGRARDENAHALAVCYQNQAELECEEGRPEVAFALYAKVEELHRISGDKLNNGKVHLLVGRLHCANGDAENGFQSFKRAIAVFLDLNNPLWMARASRCMAKLYAQHEHWEESAKAAFAAIDGFKDAGRCSEHVTTLLFAAKLLSKLLEWDLRESVRRQIHEISKTAPKNKEPEIMASLSSQLDRVHEEIAEKVREDSGIRSLLDKAKALAEKEQLHKHLADCFMAEMHLVTRRDEKETRDQFREKAISALKKALEETDVPEQRGHLMGELSALHHELGDKARGRSWLRRAGEVFEKTGNVFGLANYHGSMAEVYRSDGDLDNEIASYERVLELIEGRSFHDLAAGTRINLANALRFRRDFAKAQALLTEAEAICEQHRMKDYINAIARNRSDIEAELSAGQAASHTLAELLGSLDQLYRYKHGNAVAYMAFWYYAWKAELMAVLRSGPGISFLVVTDDVDRFLAFAAKHHNLADHFLMATTGEPTVVAEKGAIAIPPSWLFPADFGFLFLEKSNQDSGEFTDAELAETDDGVPNMTLSGPARMLPVYIPISVQSETEGEMHLSALATPQMPRAAVELMTRRPITELTDRHAIWFPYRRFSSKDAFLTDLRIAHERGLIPVYLDRIPTSDQASHIGAIIVQIPASALDSVRKGSADKWKRALLKVPFMAKSAAQAFLAELPDMFSTDSAGETQSSIEVHLFEFTEIGRKVIRPVLLVR